MNCSMLANMADGMEIIFERIKRMNMYEIIDAYVGAVDWFCTIQDAVKGMLNNLAYPDCNPADLILTENEQEIWNGSTDSIEDLKALLY